MAKAAGLASRGEGINHFNGLTLRVMGGGNLQVNYYSLDDAGDAPTGVPVQQLLPYAMVTTTKKQPTLLANVREQRSSIEFKVTEKDEWFQIERMVVFIKPLYTQFPGRG